MQGKILTESGPLELSATELNFLRRRIDAVDEMLLRLMAKRCDLVRRVQALKRARGMPARSPGREAEIFTRAREFARGFGIPDEVAVAVLENAVRCCLRAAGVDPASGPADSTRD